MTNPPDKRIVRFLKKHHVLTLATCTGNMPHCSNMFYAYLEEENMFAFTSAAESRHAREILSNGTVGGSVVLETKIVGKIQGVQFNGYASRPQGELLKKAKSRYLKRFPYAVFTDIDLWVVALTFLKMTDNTLGFGKKLIWEEHFGITPDLHKIT